jgi:hypothetical protein
LRHLLAWLLPCGLGSTGFKCLLAFPGSFIYRGLSALLTLMETPIYAKSAHVLCSLPYVLWGTGAPILFSASESFCRHCRPSFSIVMLPALLLTGMRTSLAVRNGNDEGYADRRARSLVDIHTWPGSLVTSARPPFPLRCGDGLGPCASRWCRLHPWGALG